MKKQKGDSMGRYKTSPLKKSLTEYFLPVPKWLTMSMGLDTAVCLCEIIDIADHVNKGKHLDECNLAIYAKRIMDEYGISRHRQNKSYQALRECWIFRFHKRNKYRNRKITFKLNYCWVIFEILKRLENDMRKPFFEKLKTSSKLRKLVRTVEEEIEETQVGWDNILPSYNDELAKIFKNKSILIRDDRMARETDEE